MKMWLNIFLAFIVYNTVKSQKLVMKTTCLELAKPSNKQFRLSCMNSSDYHCLLDRDSINEYEVCRNWKWIAAGKCAYFNTYREGNIDERPCISSANSSCSEMVRSSSENTKYNACYVKKSTTSTPTKTTSSFEVTSEVTSDNRNSTAYPISDITDKQSGLAGTSVAIVFGVFTSFLLFAVIYFFYQKRQSGIQNDMGLRRTDGDDVESQAHQQENATGENELNNGALQSQTVENDSDEDGGPQKQQQQLINNVNNSERHSQHLVNDSSEETEPAEHQPLIEKNNCSTSETAKTNGDEFTEPTSDERTVSDDVNSTVRESELKAGKTVTE